MLCVYSVARAARSVPSAYHLYISLNLSLSLFISTPISAKFLKGQRMVVVKRCIFFSIPYINARGATTFFFLPCITTTPTIVCDNVRMYAMTLDGRGGLEKDQNHLWPWQRKGAFRGNHTGIVNLATFLGVRTCKRSVLFGRHNVAWFCCVTRGLPQAFCGATAQRHGPSNVIPIPHLLPDPLRQFFS